MKSIVVDHNMENQRLDKVLHSILKEKYTRGNLQEAIKKGLVKINNEAKKQKYILKKDDIISFNEESLNKSEDIEPLDLDIPVLFENEDFIVLNKPAGILTHPAKSSSSPSVVNFLLFRYPEISKAGEDGRPGIVHRLDKDTSGILIVAKNQKSYEYFKRLFEKHAVKKSYLALTIERPLKKEGFIETLIGRSSKNPTKRTAISPLNPKISKTRYEVEKTLKDGCLIKAMPETGRMHQIRVHLSHIGNPILGDNIYGDKQSQSLSKKLGIKRQMLHASSIAFEFENKNYNFMALMPPDFEEAMEKMNKR